MASLGPDEFSQGKPLVIPHAPVYSDQIGFVFVGLNISLKSRRCSKVTILSHDLLWPHDAYDFGHFRDRHDKNPHSTTMHRGFHTCWTQFWYHISYHSTLLPGNPGDQQLSCDFGGSENLVLWYVFMFVYRSRCGVGFIWIKLIKGMGKLMTLCFLWPLLLILIWINLDSSRGK